ncbi:MAG: RNA methyltransferase [Alphaproteobacteria bacterium]
MSQNLKARGYFGIGIEQVSKPGNMGNLIRSAHAFGASFVFTINPGFSKKQLMRTDTSSTFETIPYYQYGDIDELNLPLGCELVVIELTKNAIPLPSFRHPRRAVYVLGPEKESISTAVLGRAQHVIQIPMKFCVNVATAGAIVLYDRLLQQGRFPDRPVRSGGPLKQLKPHVHGGVFSRQKKP